MVSEVRDVLHPLISSKHLHVKSAINSTLSPIVVDPGKFKQVLYNYLSNAIKFTPDEGSITIRIRPEKADAFCLEVEDSGMGIQAEDIERLFVEFQQGTGLGLALTKRIVEAQGGTVGVRSAPEQGSTFFAILPRETKSVNTEATSYEEREMLPPSLSFKSPSVLIIEDDPRDMTWLKKTLHEAGFTIEVATTGKQALIQCQQQTFDLITLDLFLPDLGGWEVLKTIRTDGPNQNVPVIVITMVTDRKVGLGFPINDLLNKPVRVGDLMAALQRIGIITQSAHPNTDDEKISL
jgi:CheY-like chemotaxis protein